ncbi:MAG: hydrogenase expression/formation protein HypE [Nitrosomonas sp.]|jgi:hydrogenase expression/formation protein HypE|nr:hydrogenase expression/formation protein HypE [Nitrosomonas sp.]
MTKTTAESFTLTCPIPLVDYPRVLMAHGSGGRMMQQLIEKMFYRAFDNPELLSGHDGVTLDVGGIEAGKVVFTTDSYVIRPLFFPGGDIGSLAIFGTVNDLAMCGARPRYLSAGFILEEGLAMETLWQVVCSMRRAADLAGVKIVTGDTKVVEKGKGDGLYINTAGIGEMHHAVSIHPQSVQPGDKIIVSGDIGRHGMAVMAQREGLSFESDLASDAAPLNHCVMALLDAGLDIHCLRDITRGGLAAVLCEIAQSAAIQIDIDQQQIPVSDAVSGACELLGLNPLHVACEGRFVAFVTSAAVEKTREIMASFNQGDPACIGEVTAGEAGLVTMKTAIGGQRILDMPSGELLPRIC